MTKKKKKEPHEMTTDEAMRHLFPKKVHEHLKRVAHEKDRPAAKKGKGRASRPRS